MLKALLKASTSFKIRDNKTNVEWLLKQSVHAFKLIQHRFNFHPTCFNTVGGKRGGETVSTSLLKKLNGLVEANVGAFCPGFNSQNAQTVTCPLGRQHCKFQSCITLSAVNDIRSFRPQVDSPTIKGLCTL